MSFPPRLKENLLTRFDELLQQGEDLRGQIRTIEGKVRVSSMNIGYDASGGQRPQSRAPDKHIVSWEPFVQWRTSAATLLDKVVPRQSNHRETVERFSALKDEKRQLEWALAVLRSLRDDFQRGLLDPLADQIEAEVAVDLMEQAERLMDEGEVPEHEHIPAAVLAGAVLERALRTLCSDQEPPIDTQTDGGRPKKLNVMIADLKKAEVYNEMRAKQLRVWAGIRNNAAHGHFEEFTRADVEEMLRGIGAFLADYLA